MDSWLETFAQTHLLRSGDTAHDLKTPLNVAVLNLELLRMRVKKLTGTDDRKLAEYAQGIDTELRRMASIVDTFFLLSTPPREGGEPGRVDVCAICSDSAAAAGYTIHAEGRSLIRAHEARIRQAFKLLFDGAERILRPENRCAEVSRTSQFRLTISGLPAAEDLDLTKVFKFYYTDPLGNPDLSFAAARLIAETYGGEVIGSADDGRISFGISFPLGEE